MENAHRNLFIRTILLVSLSHTHTQTHLPIPVDPFVASIIQSMTVMPLKQ